MRHTSSSSNMFQGKATFTVAAIIFNNKNEVLLVKNTEKSGHKTDSYGLPAGRIEDEEDTIETCIRETKEETGLDLKSKDLHRMPSVYFAELERKDGKKMFCQMVYFTNELTGTLSKEGDKTEPVWVKINSLDELNIIGNIRETIREALELK